MRDQLLLLPGWGLGTAPLQPLASALQGLNGHWRVQVEALPLLHGSDPVEWLDALDALLPQDCWLGGWSLGGMLATLLAERRGARCGGLLTLASNGCFTVRPDWLAAMPVVTFQRFLRGLRDSPVATRKRFALLCAQGVQDPRGLARQLSAAAPDLPPESLLAGLQLLAKLDTRAALRAFRGPQLHLFGAADALVPAAAAHALLSLRADIEVGLVSGASHALVLERPLEVAAWIQSFLGQYADD